MSISVTTGVALKCSISFQQSIKNVALKCSRASSGKDDGGVIDGEEDGTVDMKAKQHTYKKR